MALFLGLPGEPVLEERRELLDFVMQGKINRGRHTDHPAGRYSIRTNQCSPPPSPIVVSINGAESLLSGVSWWITYG